MPPMRNADPDAPNPGDDPPGGVLYTDTRGEIAALEEKLSGAYEELSVVIAEGEWIEPILDAAGFDRLGNDPVLAGMHREVRAIIVALREEIARLTRERDEARGQLADAAMLINCAGPLPERIKVLTREHAECVDALRAEVERLRAITMDCDTCREIVARAAMRGDGTRCARCGYETDGNVCTHCGKAAR